MRRKILITAVKVLFTSTLSSQTLKFFSLVDFLVDIVFDGYPIINLNLNNFELVVQTYEVNPLVVLSTLPY